MRFEDVGEVIEVLAWFRRGKLCPLRFLWRQRVHPVKQITGDWQTEIGEHHFRHFAVMSDGPDVFELSYNETSYIWRLEKVAMNG